MSRFAVPALWVLLFVLALRFARDTASDATRRSDGFAAYYTSARLIRENASGPRIYNDAWFSAEVTRFVPGVRDIYNANPPTTSLILLPLSWARYAVARSLWTALNVAVLVATLLLIVREAGLRRPAALVFVCLVLACQPLQANMRQGQVYVLLLALATVVWIGLRRGGNSIAGAALGVMIAVKSAGALLPILFLMERRWRGLIGSVLGGLLLSAMSLIWFSTATWRAYFRAVLRLRTEPDLSLTAYQTVPSLLRHLFVFDATWNRSPLVDAPLAASILTLVVTVVLIGMTVLATRGLTNIDLPFAALLTLSIVLSPVSLDYHYTLLLLPLAIVASEAQTLGDFRIWIALAVSAALMLTNLPYTSDRFAGGIWILFGYPKLAGALLLWASAISLAQHAATGARSVPAESRSTSTVNRHGQESVA